MHKHVLSGCRPKPMASYLKALGVLRLVAEQEKDPHIKGCWEGESFSIYTKLDRHELETFFCLEYAPTPIVAPWNGGSGFYVGDAVEGMEAIVGSNDSRFANYRKIIANIRAWPEMPMFKTVGDVGRTLNIAVEGMQPGKKRNELEGMLQNIELDAPSPEILGGKHPPEYSLDEVESLSKQKDNPNRKVWKDWWNVIKKARTKCNNICRSQNKKVILPYCRSRLPESSLHWLDAVCALQADGQASFNPILGTGGNEGRLELSNNFMQRLAELFITGDPERVRSLFHSSVFSTVSSGLVAAKIGQYDPGRAGGYNQGMEVETKDFKINPWDFVLALEGALVLAGAIVRRNPTDERSLFTTPFTVFFSSVGFSSSAYEEAGRHETWLPLWHKPAPYIEVKYLFGEGRSAIGRRVARTGIEFSRAVGTLGVDRGIDAFERYAFLVRRGQSKVALPAGRLAVRYRPRLELLNELDTVALPAWRFMRAFKALPATFQSARRRIDETIFVCCQKSDAHSFCNLVRAIGNLEKLIAMRDRTKKPVMDRPLFDLSPRWILNCDEGSTEVRIAAALASIKATGKVGPLRSNLAGVDPSNPWRWGEGKGGKYWFGSSLAERLSGVLLRRLMDAERSSTKQIPIEAGLPLSPYDVMPFLWKECDDTKLEELLWGFTLINWRKPGAKTLRKQWKRPVDRHPLSRTWCLLKLLHSPQKIRNKKEIKKELRIAHLLAAGRVRDACDAAIHRLRVSDLHPLNVIYEEQIDSVQLLASLLIPVSDQRKLESLVLEEESANT